MSNPNQHQTYSREVWQESNQDTDSNVTRTTETVDNTKVTPNRELYRDGYAKGRIAELHYQQANLVERDNNNAARGLLLGIIVTSLAALTAGAVWLLSQRNETPTPVTQPVVVPAKPEASPPPQANQLPKRETKIIEREKPVFVPVPQPAPSPTSSPAAQPEVNLTTPNSALQPPATESAPVTQPAPTQPQSQSNSTETQVTPSNTDTPNSVEGTANQPSTTSNSSSAPDAANPSNPAD